MINFYPESLCPKVKITEEIERSIQHIIDILVEAGVASDPVLERCLEKLWMIASTKPEVLHRIEKEYDTLYHTHYWGLIGECGFQQWHKGNWRIAIRNAKKFIDTLKRTPDFRLGKFSGDVKFSTFSPPFLQLRVPIRQLRYDIYVLTTFFEGSVRLVGYAAGSEVAKAKQRGEYFTMWHGHLHPMRFLTVDSWNIVEALSTMLFRENRCWRTWSVSPTRKF